MLYFIVLRACLKIRPHSDKDLISARLLLMSDKKAVIRFPSPKNGT